MSRAIPVPVTPSVLAWAIDESGLRHSDIASHCGVTVADLESWIAGSGQPGITQWKHLAKALRRPPAMFLLPQPPPSIVPSITFRAPPGTSRHAPGSAERVQLRRVARLQQLLTWVSAELGHKTVELPEGQVSEEPEAVAARVRTDLGITVAQQAEWASDAKALAAWRSALETRGILVFALPMGAEAARGFSIHSEYTPAIGLNTHWNQAARIFTLLHELGHQVSRTASLCVGHALPSATSASQDVERWCERFAAALLLPRGDLLAFVAGCHSRSAPAKGLTLVRRVADQFKVSLRAATLRLLELNKVAPELYGALPSSGDAKSGGGGGEGRTRMKVRYDEYWKRTMNLFAAGLAREVLAPLEVMRYLDVRLGDLDVLVAGRE